VLGKHAVHETKTQLPQALGARLRRLDKARRARIKRKIALYNTLN
jgi:hypothetical protein